MHAGIYFWATSIFIVITTDSVLFVAIHVERLWGEGVKNSGNFDKNNFFLYQR